MTKIVQITAEDIETGIKGNSSHCMIADAIKRTFPTLTKVSVDLATIRWSDPKTNQRLIFLTPAIAQAALLDFDNGLPVEPFRIRVGKPAQVVPMRKIYKKPGLADVTSQAIVDRARQMQSEGMTLTAIADKFNEENIPTTRGGKKWRDSSLRKALNPTRGEVPTRAGGRPPALGPLPGGDGQAMGRTPKRTGKIRGFGVRQMTR